MRPRPGLFLRTAAVAAQPDRGDDQGRAVRVVAGLLEDGGQNAATVFGAGLGRGEGQVFAGLFQHHGGHARQGRDLQAITLVGRAGLDTVQEDDGVAVFRGVKMHVGDRWLLLGQGRELEIVRREEGVGVDAARQLHGAGPGQREAVEGARAAADLVHQHEALLGGVVQDRRGLGHFHHERRAPAGQVVGGADAGEDAVEGPDHRFLRRHEAAHVGEDGDQRGLAHVGGLAAHVRPGYDQQPALGIQGNVDLLLISLDAADPRYENTRNIERCIRSGANLTRQLLGYARGGKYFVKPINLNDVVQTSSNLFGRTKKETKVICKYQDNIWIVEADQSQIEQVLMNLYLNAWQAMGPGGTIHVKTENTLLDSDFVKPYEAVPGKYVSVSVADTGRGMDQETQKRVYEPFFTTKSMGKGTGMGLASAFGILRNHNGIIRFASTLGTGTTFYIYLPASDLTADS